MQNVKNFDFHSVVIWAGICHDQNCTWGQFLCLQGWGKDEGKGVLGRRWNCPDPRKRVCGQWGSGAVAVTVGEKDKRDRHSRGKKLVTNMQLLKCALSILGRRKELCLQNCVLQLWISWDVAKDSSPPLSRLSNWLRDRDNEEVKIRGKWEFFIATDSCGLGLHLAKGKETFLLHFFWGKKGGVAFTNYMLICLIQFIC